MSEPLEIERKFLVKNDGWRKASGPGVVIRQGYLASGEPSVRVRIKGERGYLTVKAEKAWATRHEYDYEIPRADAAAMLGTLCTKPALEKTRYEVSVNAKRWEIDVFSGANAGLIVAEIELERADEPLHLPEWAGPEVTNDPRFFNVALYARPFSTWGTDYAALLRTLG